MWENSLTLRREIKKEQTGGPPCLGTQMGLLLELCHCYFTGAFFHWEAFREGRDFVCVVHGCSLVPHTPEIFVELVIFFSTFTYED